MLSKCFLFVVVFFIIFSAAAHAKHHHPIEDVLSYKFEEYIKDFGYDWKVDSVEWKHHLDIFKQRIQEIHDHNTKSINKSYKLGITKFTALSNKDMKKYMGNSKSMRQHHQPKSLKSHNINMKPVSELPTEVDWRSSGIVSAVKDQGGCGSCWAFAATATLESHIAKETGLLFSLSPQQIASCSPNPDKCGGTGGCEGATAEVAFDYVAQSSTGILQEYAYPYLSYYGSDYDCNTDNSKYAVATIDGYTQLSRNNYTELMNAIAQVGPIAVSVDAMSWGSYTGGVYNGCTESPDIDHAVTLVGYGVDEKTSQKYWLIRNSWSAAWGESGYIRLLRSDDDDNNCAIDTTPQDGYACDGDTTPIKVCGMCGVLSDSSYPIGADAYAADDGRKP